MRRALSVVVFALLAAMLGFVGCSKTNITQYETKGEDQSSAASIIIQLAEDGLGKSTSVLEIMASFTGGRKELLAASYTVPYDMRQWFVLYKDGQPVYNVVVNDQAVPASAISEGKIYFTYLFNPLGIRFENMTPGAKLTKVMISYIGLPGDSKVQVRGSFNAWTWVNMRKTDDTTWVAPDSSTILANPDLNQINVLGPNGADDYRLKKIYVNDVLLTKAEITRKNDHTINTAKIFFTKNPQTGAIINPGNEDLYEGSFHINP